MDLQRKKWTVLARIPDLNAAGADGAADEEAGGGLPASTGRLIKQALSFRLLVGTALFLLVAAVMPFALRQEGPIGRSVVGNRPGDGVAFRIRFRVGRHVAGGEVPATPVAPRGRWP